MRHFGAGTVGANADLRFHSFIIESKAALANRLAQRRLEGCLHILKRHTVVRQRRPGHIGGDFAQIELQRIGIFSFGAVSRAEKLLRFKILFDALHNFFRAPGQAHIAQGFIVNGEEAHRSAILGGHVRNRRPIGQGEHIQARAVELHKLADHTLFTQHLHDTQHQIGGCDAIRQVAK